MTSFGAGQHSSTPTGKRDSRPGTEANSEERNTLARAKRILFVDDEPDILLVYEMMFKGQDWKMDFAENGFKALEMMARTSYDAIISDMRMPRINGAQLLNETTRLHPHAARFIISGYAERELVLECLRGTHQFLSKPFEVGDLKTKVLRSMEANEWLGSEAINTVVGKLFTLPSIPSSYFQLIREIESPNAEAENVGKIIARDPAMTAKLLQLVNSAFFGLSRTISNPTEAVFHLGMQTVRSLALGVHIFSEFEEFHATKLPLQALMEHSLRTADLAQRIAQHEQVDTCSTDDAFAAGLLMDIGRLIIAQNLIPESARIRELAQRDGKPIWEAERELLGVSHAEVGGYLLALWGLPIAIVEAVLHHHHPARCKTANFSPLVCVHVANALAYQAGNNSSSPAGPCVDVEWLTRLGFESHLPAWQQLAVETSSDHAE
jgi:HD-like signal output (HDOD) protein/ActR/RegA family two-component response regulator